ncbi:MAG: efflux RND transporter periplasmic adaptor subunit [Rhodanobacter sp.]
MNKSRWIALAVIVVLLALIGGYFVGKRGRPTTGSATPGTESATARKILYWKAPMDPNFRKDKPGKSPTGMDLVPVYADAGAAGEASDVKIAPDVVNNLGVRTVKVEQGSLSHQLELVGYVGYDEDTITSLNTRAEGWIEKLGVKSAGDSVRAGQMLYELFSPKLATAEREYLVALASGSPSLIAASRERMKSLGFSGAQVTQLARTRKVSDRVARYADSAGVLMSLGVSEGAYVMPATQIMKLADIRTVWVLVEVDESAAALLHTGQKADAVFDAFPGQHWQGVVDHVYPDISSTTRTVKARVRFDNPDLRLQPNMYAHVTLQAAPKGNGLYIPELALIRTGSSQRVIVALGDGRFDVCPVQAGLSSGDRVEILKGLRAGQRVVTSAQFMLDSEANVDAAALRLGAGRAGCAKAADTTGHGSAEKADPAGKDISDMPGMSDPATPAVPNAEKSPKPDQKPPMKMGPAPHAASTKVMPATGSGSEHAPTMPMPADNGAEQHP